MIVLHCVEEANETTILRTRAGDTVVDAVPSFRSQPVDIKRIDAQQSSTAGAFDPVNHPFLQALGRDDTDNQLRKLSSNGGKG